MRFLVIILFTAFISCGDGRNANNNNESETIIYDYPDTLLAWDVKSDSMIMERQAIFPDSSLTLARIINGLNDKYPKVQIRLLRQSNDTAYIEIPDSDYLGEQMGSAGSSAWFADATINLTSVAGVNYVSYKMDLHSHAESNVLGRDAYRNWKKE